MKFSKLWDGPTPEGESQVNALARVDAPYLTAKGADYVTYKKNGVYEVYKETDRPYLWGTYLMSSGEVVFGTANPEDHYGRRQQLRVIFFFTGRPYVDCQALKVFAGDDYVWRLVSDTVNTLLTTTIFWPTLNRATEFGGEHDTSEPPADTAGKSMTFINDVQIDGLGSTGHKISLLCTGWQNDTRRYRFSLTANYYADSMDKDNTRVAVAFAGDTGTRTIAQSSVQYVPNRQHTHVRAGVIGPGKAQYLQAVTEVIDTTIVGPVSTFKPKVQPFLVTTTDHGDNWTVGSGSGAFLESYLIKQPMGTTYNRDYYENAQLESKTANAGIGYVGTGKHILIIPNGYVDGTDAASNTRYAPMAFLGSGGGGYSRLSWPADTWYVDKNGTPLVSGTPIIGPMKITSLHAAWWGFGQGCFYIPIKDSDGWKVMFTHDFGSSWSMSGVVPTDIVEPGDQGFAFTIVRPYEGADKPGRLLAFAPSSADNKLRFYACDGTFASFKNLGAIDKAAGSLSSSSGAHRYFVNYGGKVYKPFVHPGFPGEFDKP
jgi:hypothetical protein